VTEQTTISFVVRGPIARPDLPGLCVRLRGEITSHNARCALCEVGGLGADAVAVDALARLRITARRCGCVFQPRGWSRKLGDLVALMGLQEILLD
jgi:ABC-type transporter Mla MlaB component